MSTIAFQPLQDRLVVRRSEPETKTPGGLIIPDAAKERPVEGVVLAVGPGRALDSGATRPLAVKVGDRVLFAKYAGTETRINGEDLVLLQEDDVLGVLVPA